MINKVTIIGRLGSDPEINSTESTKVTNFNVATNEVWFKDGEKQERTEWHRVVAFGKLAEICGQYLEKGKLVYIEGKLRTDKWESEDGVSRQTTRIIANTMRILAGTSSDETNININADDIPF